MDSKINGNMLVKDLVNAIANKEIKVVDLAKNYSTSDRTIQTKIKKLGFVWASKEGKYDFIGEDLNVYDLTIDEVFKSKKVSKTNSVPTVEKASKEIASTTQNTSQFTPEINSDSASKKESVKVIKNSSNTDSDNIDRLLAGKKPKKEYRGFYFDSDVLAIIDSVSNGVKSELVNECLRKVFKDKGLL